MAIIYVVPSFDYQNGWFYLDYAVRESGVLTNRSERFDSAESASARLLALQALVVADRNPNASKAR
jgi:hypothetical protein